MEEEMVVVKAADVGLALRRKSVVDAERKALKAKESQVFKEAEPQKPSESIYVGDDEPVSVAPKRK